MCCSFSGFWSHDPNVLLVAGGGGGYGGLGEGRTNPFFLLLSFCFYALLSSGFVWMLLSVCTLISIVSGLRDSFPFSSFSGSFLWMVREKKKKKQGVKFEKKKMRVRVMTKNNSTAKCMAFLNINTVANKYLPCKSTMERWRPG